MSGVKFAIEEFLIHKLREYHLERINLDKEASLKTADEDIISIKNVCRCPDEDLMVINLRDLGEGGVWPNTVIWLTQVSFATINK